MRAPLSGIRLPFTVYRLPFTVDRLPLTVRHIEFESLKGLDVGAAYFCILSCAWLWVDGLKGLDVGGSTLFQAFNRSKTSNVSQALSSLFKP